MLTLDISSYLVEKAAFIEKELESLIKVKNTPYKGLYEAGRYSLLGGGKRLRPILTLATAETLGCSETVALAPACALEMIHTYSLIHDDLPCMDDDDFRRGKPSLHKAFGEANAVLAGDFLLTYAFEVIASDPQLSPNQKVDVIQIISTCAGANGMIGGQFMDIASENQTIDLDMLKTIHRHKTGALLSAAVLCGAIVANASPAQKEALALFGQDIGLAFQIVDDILDLTSSEKKHGKKVSSDIVNNKSTYVTLMGIEAAQKTADVLLKSSFAHLDKLGCDTTLLQSLARRLVDRTA